MNYIVLIGIGILLKETLAAKTNIKGKQASEPESETNPPPAPPPPTPVETDDELDNDAFIKNFDDAAFNIACEWMSLADPAKYRLNLDREMSYEDATKLTFLVKGKKLHTNFLALEEDLTWKRNLINQLWSLYESACPNSFVNNEYMNIMRELLIVYINSVEPRTSPEPEVWTAIIESLVQCESKNLPAHNFTSTGLLISKLVLPDPTKVSVRANDDDDTIAVDETENGNGTSGGGGGEEDKLLMDLQPQVDNAELVFKLDIIIDNLWQVFSHAWARCLPTASSRDLWGPRFKQLFFRDILEPLEQRWANPGEGMRSFLDLIVGDYDVARMQANIPYCTQAAYINPKGTHLESQLVRPLKLTDIDRGVSKFQNTRV